MSQLALNIYFWKLTILEWYLAESVCLFKMLILGAFGPLLSKDFAFLLGK
jgi:hypothetical protein